MNQAGELTQEQISRWGAAQQGETQYWQEWMAKSSDLSDAQWLLYVLQYFGLADRQSFGSETLVDIGSGPIGLLTRLQADCRIAVDPLPIDTIDLNILRLKRPGEKTGLPSKIADRVFIYNLLQHVISPDHVLNECSRLLKPNGSAYILEQLNLPTDNEHPHSLKIEMFDQWIARENLQVEQRLIEPDRILSSINPARPGSGYCVLCLIVKKPA